jgi:hypothetical protein
VSNFGAANPPAPRGASSSSRASSAARPAHRVVHGDDLSGPAHRERFAASSAADRLARDRERQRLPRRRAIAAALRAGAQIVVAGRVADPSLSWAR